MIQMNTLLKAHSGSWLESRAYRLAWLMGPMVMVMLVFGSKFWITPGNKLSLLPAPLDYTVQEYESIRAGLRANDPATLAALEAAAEANDSRALNYMGILYDPSLGRVSSALTPNLEVALAHYEKSAAAGGGVLPLENAGLMLTASGKWEEGCKLLYRAFQVDSERLETKAAAGRCMAKEKNTAERLKGIEMMESAGAAGLARAYALLGTTYVTQTPPDAPRAIANFEKAVAGNVEDNGHSLYSLGLVYYRGLGVRQDMNKGIDYLLEAFKKGSSKAALELSVAFNRGFGVRADQKKALEYARSAANSGEPLGHLNLYFSYRLGLGTEKNADLAVTHLLTAISLGDEKAIDEVKRLKPSDGPLIAAVQFKLAKAMLFSGRVDGQLSPDLEGSLRSLLGSGRRFE